ncbi:MAG: ankyrin repeat domain-containing protein [Blastocatellia bacterium]
MITSNPELPVTKCLTCNQADYFDISTGYCTKCYNFSLSQVRKDPSTLTNEEKAKLFLPLFTLRDSYKKSFIYDPEEQVKTTFDKVYYQIPSVSFRSKKKFSLKIFIIPTISLSLIFGVGGAVFYSDFLLWSIIGLLVGAILGAFAQDKGFILGFSFLPLIYVLNVIFYVDFLNALLLICFGMGLFWVLTTHIKTYWSGKENPEIIKKLLSLGTDNHNRTALIWAVIYKHKTLVQSLLELNAEINSKDENGFTALHWATLLRRYDLIKVLIDAGADVKALDSHGFSSLVYAQLASDGESIKILSPKSIDNN